MKDKILTIDDIDLFVFDFDGVLTDNLVYTDQNGNEMVSCSRADGLAFDVLRKLKKPVYILSTEENTVVSARAKKLGVSVLQGVKSKEKSLRNLVKRKGYKLSSILYVGNDLNDYNAMQLCGYTACPIDSHIIIKQLATYTLKTKGGEGVVRELLEDIMKLDFIQIFYSQ